MATRPIVPINNGEGSLGTSTKKWETIYTNEINNDANLGNNYSLGYRRPNQAYAVGDIAYTSALPITGKLVCVKAGTSAAGNLTLSSTAEGTLATDGTVTWQVDSLADGNYSAGHGNIIYRGADVTAYFESGLLSTNIATGMFVGIHIGDFIRKSIVVDGATYTDDWIIGDFNYHLHRGNTETTANHILVFPRGTFGAARMNATDVTTGGFLGSEMWGTTLPKYTTAIKATFGASHVLKHRESLTNTVDATAVSGACGTWNGTTTNWAWTDVEVNLFNETMIYGGRVLSSSMYDVGDCNTQVAAMHHDKSSSFTHAGWNWLRAVAGSTSFCRAGVYGDAGSYYASDALGRVRPYFLLT